MSSVSDRFERLLFGATAHERIRLMTRRVQQRLVAVLESLEADDLLEDLEADGMTTEHGDDEMARRIHETRDAPASDLGGNEP